MSSSIRQWKHLNPCCGRSCFSVPFSSTTTTPCCKMWCPFPQAADWPASRLENELLVSVSQSQGAQPPTLTPGASPAIIPGHGGSCSVQGWSPRPRRDTTTLPRTSTTLWLTLGGKYTPTTTSTRCLLHSAKELEGQTLLSTKKIIPNHSLAPLYHAHGSVRLVPSCWPLLCTDRHLGDYTNAAASFKKHPSCRGPPMYSRCWDMHAFSCGEIAICREKTWECLHEKRRSWVFNTLLQGAGCLSHNAVKLKMDFNTRKKRNDQRQLWSFSSKTNQSQQLFWYPTSDPGIIS